MRVYNSYAATIPSAEFQFTSKDGLHIVCARWDSRDPVRGVVQIAHGMGEHIDRYTSPRSKFW
jgi:alpha-beta hydrolase superfamily lysophospholipase